MIKFNIIEKIKSDRTLKNQLILLNNCSEQTLDRHIKLELNGKKSKLNDYSNLKLIANYFSVPVNDIIDN